MFSIGQVYFYYNEWARNLKNSILTDEKNDNTFPIYAQAYLKYKDNETIVII